ncbi:DUF4166 domain-containing protein [Maritalea sp.]|jgi:predicted phosphohydrolase|uniref:DUF4166 domain-containing protein n=1 Tax=Maritalea sp. TaxID=2003361 RepID=UPI0039E2F2AE
MPEFKQIKKRILMAEADPFFMEIFGNAWATMPDVFHKHYANRAFCDDAVKVTGTMSIWQSPIMRPAAFLFRWTKTLIPVTAENLAAEVIFRTRSDSDKFWYDRTVRLQGGETLNFVSYLEPKGGNQVVEWTGSGIGWHSTFQFEDNRVHLRHLGYRFRLGKLDFPLPLTWLFGTPSAWEEAISETEFKMEMTIDHAVFGRIYSYTGQFEIKDIALAK